ncbi:MAG TPA: 2-C-methyl-D-erythritol 4-phosphate cytidylyltransferase [Lachnospiraceae bacterium]|nr:2-C-methyl-D-erythritol 4-phosphate cytidylyltransferase [Lachnospiraceae bacterium]
MSNKTIAILLAAGSGKRMNSEIHKQYLTLKGKPVLYYALKVFEESFLDEIILVVGSGEVEYCKNEIVNRYGFSKVSKVIEGGAERYHSVYKGILAIDLCDYLFIHDGARPFVSREILNRALLAVKQHKACVVGMPVKDTVKIIDENRFISETPKRDLVWSVQTPQCFSFSIIKDAYHQLMMQEDQLLQNKIQISDDAMVLELLSDIPVKLVEGSYENIKITTKEDMKIAESLF